MTESSPLAAPYTLVLELTYRCPLRCAYCSNPTNLAEHDGHLSTATWRRVVEEAEALGVVHVHFTGGEPLLRADLEELVAHAHSLGTYTTLVTSGVPLVRERWSRLAEAGLDAVQLSFQGTEPGDGERFAGRDRLEEKIAVARWVRESGVALTVNVVLHRGNIHQTAAIVALAEELGADRLELANVQLLGWALENRAALLPDAKALQEARAVALAAKRRLAGRMDLVFVVPDYHTGVPRACMDGWGRRTLVVSPAGRVLPCQVAHTLPGLTFPSVLESALADLWATSPGLNRFRGHEWMPEPCRSCERRDIDFGGCRCQAYHLAGDAAKTDPTCQLAPDHGVVRAARAEAAAAPLVPIRLRRASVLEPRDRAADQG